MHQFPPYSPVPQLKVEGLFLGNIDTMLNNGFVKFRIDRNSNVSRLQCDICPKSSLFWLSPMKVNGKPQDPVLASIANAHTEVNQISQMAGNFSTIYP